MQKTILAAAIVSASAVSTTVVSPLAFASTTQEIERVSVTASRVEVPKSQLAVSVSVLTAADIEKLGYNTLLDVVRTLPGISISNNGGMGKVSSVYVRGEHNSRTLVLLDGVNIADPTNTQVAAQFQHLLASDVERVEVLRGPQGMMYGAGAGGVINIISKRAEQPLELQLSGESGRYGTNKAQVGVRGAQDSWNYALNLSALRSDGFNSRTSDTSGERDGYDNRSYRAQLGYQFSENFSIEGQASRVAADTDFDGCYNASFSPVNNCLDEYTQTSYQLKSDLQTGAVAHDILLAKQEIDRDSLSDGFSSFAVQGAIEELNYFGDVALPAGNLSWGADLEQQEFESAYDAHDLDSTGVFAEWRGDVASKVYYNLGYRLDRLDSEDHNSIRVSAAVPQLLSDNQQLKYRASYSTGFRAPSPYEVSSNLGAGIETPLGPESSRGFEVGVEYQYANLVQLELVAFQQTITDAIVYDYSLGTWGAYGQDDGESESDGVELSLAGSLSDALNWYANATWLDTKDLNGDQRLQVPQDVYNLGASYSFLDNKLTLAGNWQLVADRLSPNPIYLGDPIALDTFNKLDLKAAYQVSDSTVLTLRGENLLNESYSEVAGYNAMGSALYAGVQFSL